MNLALTLFNVSFSENPLHHPCHEHPLQEALHQGNIYMLPPDCMDNNYYLYTLPTQLQECGQIAILDTKITDYNLVHYLPMLTVNWRDKRKSDRWQKGVENG